MPHTDLPPLGALTAFEAAARLGSLTAAAERLGSSQPAISQQIRKLEADLDAKLFHRLHRGVALTEAGQALFDATQQGFALIGDAAQRIRQPLQRERVAIASDFGFAALWLLPRLADFRAQHPEVEVSLVTGQRDFDLRHEPVDLAVVCGPTGSAQGVSRQLFPETVLPVCSPKLLAEHGAPADAAALLDLPLLVLDDDRRERWFSWESWLRMAGITEQPRGPTLHFDNYSLLVQAAIAGQGVALGWEALVAEMMASGLLLATLDLPLSSSRGYQVVVPASRPLSEPAWALHEWLFCQARTDERAKTLSNGG